MGAYSFLTKKVGYQKANEIIHSNKTYAADEILQLGIINKVCEDGHGLTDIYESIKNGELGTYVNDPFLNICNRVSRKELLDIVNVWLDRAFILDEDNLTRMTKLSNFQKRKLQQNKEVDDRKSELRKLKEVDTLINSSFQSGVEE